MHTRFSNLKRGVVALATLGLLAGGFVVNAPAANAATGRIVYTDGGDIEIYDNGTVTTVDDGPFWEYASFCGQYVVAETGGDLWRIALNAFNGADAFVQLHDDTTSPPGAAEDPACSPDGTRVAFVSALDDSQVWVDYVQPNVSQPTLIADLVVGDLDGPAWSPDGSRIVVSELGGADSLYQIQVATGAAQQITVPDGTQVDPTYLDNSRILYVVDPAGNDTAIVGLGDLNVVDGPTCDMPSAGSNGDIVCTDGVSDRLHVGPVNLNGTEDADQPDAEAPASAAPAPGPGPGPGTGTIVTSKSLHNFGKVSKHKTVTKAITVTAVGGSASPLPISMVGSSKFSQSNNCPATLSAGQSCTVFVTYHSGGSGSHSASLIIDGHVLPITGKHK